MTPCEESSWRKPGKGGYYTIHAETHNGYTRLHVYLYAKHHKIRIDSSTHEVRHLCNNPSCLNMDHLELGSRRDNVRDSLYAGTFNRSKLVPKDVLEIRRLYKETDLSQSQIARKFNISMSTVQSIITKRRWGWVQ